MLDTMVPGFAFTINSMDYGQSILLMFDILGWMLAPESGTAGNKLHYSAAFLIRGEKTTSIISCISTLK